MCIRDRDQIVEIATSKLDSELKRLSFEKSFVLDSINKLEIPRLTNQNSTTAPSGYTVWAVEFVDDALPLQTNIQNPSTKLTIWVTKNLDTSSLFLNCWHPTDLLKTIDNDRSSR